MNSNFLILMNELQTILLTSLGPPVIIDSEDGRMMRLACKAIDRVGILEEENSKLKAELNRI